MHVVARLTHTAIDSWFPGLQAEKKRTLFRRCRISISKMTSMLTVEWWSPEAKAERQTGQVRIRSPVDTKLQLPRRDSQVNTPEQTDYR